MPLHGLLELAPGLLGRGAAFLTEVGRVDDDRTHRFGRHQRVDLGGEGETLDIAAERPGKECCRGKAQFREVVAIDGK